MPAESTSQGHWSTKPRRTAARPAVRAYGTHKPDGDELAALRARARATACVIDQKSAEAVVVHEPGRGT